MIELTYMALLNEGFVRMIDDYVDIKAPAFIMQELDRAISMPWEPIPETPTKREYFIPDNFGLSGDEEARAKGMWEHGLAVVESFLVTMKMMGMSDELLRTYTPQVVYESRRYSIDALIMADLGNYPDMPVWTELYLSTIRRLIGVEHAQAQS